MIQFLKSRIVLPVLPTVIVSIVLIVAGGFFFVTRTNVEPEDRLPRAPNFRMLGWSGEEILFEQYRGKPIVLNFWAAWCTFCREEMPILEKISKKYREDGLVVIGAHRTATESRASGAAFAEKIGLTYLLVQDPYDNLYRFFLKGASFMPVTVYIDREGLIRETVFGPRTEEQMEALIRNIVES